MRFEIDSAKVDDIFKSVTKEMIKQVQLPGFRPGKAPEAMAAKHCEKQIEEEVKRKLISEAYHQGVKDQRLEVLGYPDIEEIKFERGQPLQFAATVEINPQFDLPEYRGLPAKRESALVTDEDVTKAIDALRGQAATFDTVDRAVQEGDYIVVNYTGTTDGKPLTELAPTARGLTEQKAFWVEVKPTSFIPGFAMQLVGAKAGDKRTVTVDFPADFVTPQLAGKQGVYEVEVVEVKEKKLPPLEDAFAKMYGTETVDKLREGVRQDLQNDRNDRQKRGVRTQILQALTEKVTFDLPETSLQVETRNVVYELVNENKRRGVPNDIIESKKEELYSAASGIARERLKLGFLVSKISEKEGIRVDQNELNVRLAAMAQASEMPLRKFVQELEKRQGVGDIYQQLVQEKVITFLHDNARVEDAAPVS